MAYLVAVVATAAAVFMRWLLDPLLGDLLPLATLYAAVALAAGWGGARPALVAVALGYFVGRYLFIQPRGSLGFADVRDIVVLLLYLLACLIIVGFGEAMRRSQRRSADSRSHALKKQTQLEREMAARREAEEGLRRLTEEVRDYAIFMLDRQGRIVSWNPSAQRIKGYQAEEIIGQHFSCFYTEDAVREGLPVRALRAAAANGQWEDEDWRLRKDGSRFWASVVITALHNAEGEVSGFAKITRDLTDRRRGEEALRHAHAELQARVAELAHFNRLAVNRELRVIELKQEVSALHERLGEGPRHALDGEADAEEPDATEPAASSRLPGEEGDGDAPLESVLCMEELKRRPTRPPDFESETQALQALVQALADSPRTILQTLADTMVEVLQSGSAGLSLLTRDGTRFYWAAIAGAWAPHQGGGTPRDFGPCGDVLNRCTPMLFTHWERRYPYLSEATPLADEGLLVPFYVDGKPVGTIWAIVHDGHRRFDAEDLRLLESLGHFASAAYQAVETLGAADQRRAAISLTEDAIPARQVIAASEAALRAADRRKDEFLATLAHELRNPLAPLCNALELMKLSEGDTALRDEARRLMERQVRHMVRLIDDLLEVSRITRGKLLLRKERLDLAAVLQSAVELARPLIEASAHELTIVAPPEPIVLEADSIRLSQVIANLLTNAAKYTEKDGHIWLTVARQPDRVSISVRDTGIGISADHLPHVFELFSQAAPALERSQGGLGIGLSLVKSLVELHGGTVTAHSAGAGRGSEFIVGMPLGEASRELPEPGGERPALMAKSSRANTGRAIAAFGPTAG